MQVKLIALIILCCTLNPVYLILFYFIIWRFLYLFFILSRISFPVARIILHSTCYYNVEELFLLLNSNVATVDEDMPTI